MSRTFATIALGLMVGAAVTMALAVRATTAPPAPASASGATSVAGLPPAPEPPFETSISGTGVVEPRSEGVQIASEVSGVVAEVFVVPGDHVEAGLPLFRLDDRDARARLATATAELQAAVARRERLAGLPRAETVAPLRAAVEEARAQLEAAKTEQLRLGSVSQAGAVASVDVDRQRFAVRTAEARLSRSEAELHAAEAGPWAPDLRLADAEIAVEAARVDQVRTEIARLTVRAPLPGRVLERNIRTGQFAEPRGSGEPLMVMGDTSVLHVRVDVDETELWRFEEGRPAIAMFRGNPTVRADLTFVRVEPAVMPKRSFTGASTERTDTRVLRVIYAISPGAMPVRVGQLLDVRILAPSSERPGGRVEGTAAHGNSDFSARAGVGVSR